MDALLPNSQLVINHQVLSIPLSEYLPLYLPTTTMVLTTVLFVGCLGIFF